MNHKIIQVQLTKKIINDHNFNWISNRTSIHILNKQIKLSWIFINWFKLTDHSVSDVFRSVHWKTDNIADSKESRSFHQESDFLQQAPQGDWAGEKHCFMISLFYWLTNRTELTSSWTLHRSPTRVSVKRIKNWTYNYPMTTVVTSLVIMGGG